MYARNAYKDNEQQTRELAYYKWEQAGRPEGRSDEFWYQAEWDLRGNYLYLILRGEIKENCLPDDNVDLEDQMYQKMIRDLNAEPPHGCVIANTRCW